MQVLVERREIVEELSRVAKQCTSANWDGYGAAPITEETCSRARSFLDALPSELRDPAVGAEPDGQLTFEWYESPNRTLSVSVSPNGELHYAALLGAASAYGTEPFHTDAPRNILDLIRRVTGA
jgi:hypothetical protein